MVPQQVEREAGYQFLENDHRVSIVRVRLVQLERRELGIVAGRDALVAEATTDLEHLVEAADHEALEVELGRHAEVEVDVERVVVGDERARRGPAGDRVQQRRLHLHETLVPQALAHAAHDVAAQLEQGPAALVGPQVDLALAIARLGVAHPVPLVAEVAPRLGQQLPGRHLHRELTPLRAHHLARGADPVAQVQPDELVEVLGERGQREELHRSRVVAQLGEGELALGRESMMRPATPTVTPDSSPGPSDDQASMMAAASCVRSKR